MKGETPNAGEDDLDSRLSAERLGTWSVFRTALRAVGLVWRTSRGLTSLLVLVTLLAGLSPAGAAYVARFVVDRVVDAVNHVEGAADGAMVAIMVEAILVALAVGAARGLVFCQHLLKARLAHTITHQILEKAISLSLSDFEDSRRHDEMDEARREATVRPLNLVMSTFTLARNGISLAGYFALLFQLSWWAVFLLVIAGVPSFIAEARFSDEGFRFFKRHSPENRERHYLETLLTREENKKELRFFALGKRFLARYDALFEGLYREERRIATRRHAWGLALSVLGTTSFFGAYLWIVQQTIAGALTLGQMTMYIVVFRQGQSAVAAALTALGGMYDDALYLINLDVFLAHEVNLPHGTAVEGPDADDGLRIEQLSFTYPGRPVPAISGVSFHVRPGQTLAIVGHNGGGKTTLVKLLTRQYVPDAGRILLDGRDLTEWSEEGLRSRISVLFQDFNRYKLTAGENIGAGDEPHFEDRERQTRAAELGLAGDVIDELEDGLDTRLGKTFRGATQLSGGQWQRLAFARALMRQNTQILVFDEPTSAADPKRQAELDDQLRTLLEGRIGVIVSHRLATARIADEILVLDHGKIAEEGTHEELIERDGIYAALFEAQAAAYR